MTGLDWHSWLLVFIRSSALLLLFPIFSAPTFPIQLRVALAALIAVLIAPGVSAVSWPATFWGLIGLIAKELGCGLLLGFVTRLVFHILEFVGTLVSLELSLNMAAVVDPMSGQQNQGPAIMLFYLGAILFLSLDLHHVLLLAFQRSFEVLPLGMAGLSTALLQDIVRRTSQLFVVGLLMAGPILAVSFLINLVFSVLGRAVPQMNVFTESFAFRILAGLIVFGVTLNLMSQHIVNYLRRLPGDFISVGRLMAGAGG